MKNEGIYRNIKRLETKDNGYSIEVDRDAKTVSMRVSDDTEPEKMTEAGFRLNPKDGSWTAALSDKTLSFAADHAAAIMKFNIPYKTAVFHPVDETLDKDGWEWQLEADGSARLTNPTGKKTAAEIEPDGKGTVTKSANEFWSYDTSFEDFVPQAEAKLLEFHRGRRMESGEFEKLKAFLLDDAKALVEVFSNPEEHGLPESLMNKRFGDPFGDGRWTPSDFANYWSGRFERKPMDFQMLADDMKDFFAFLEKEMEKNPAIGKTKLPNSDLEITTNYWKNHHLDPLLDEMDRRFFLDAKTFDVEKAFARYSCDQKEARLDLYEDLKIMAEKSAVQDKGKSFGELSKRFADFYAETMEPISEKTGRGLPLAKDEGFLALNAASFQTFCSLREDAENGAATENELIQFANEVEIYNPENENGVKASGYEIHKLKNTPGFAMVRNIDGAHYNIHKNENGHGKEISVLVRENGGEPRFAEGDELDTLKTKFGVDGIFGKTLSASEREHKSVLSLEEYSRIFADRSEDAKKIVDEYRPHAENMLGQKLSEVFPERNSVLYIDMKNAAEKALINEWKKRSGIDDRYQNMAEDDAIAASSWYDQKLARPSKAAADLVKNLLQNGAHDAVSFESLSNAVENAANAEYTDNRFLEINRKLNLVYTSDEVKAAAEEVGKLYDDSMDRVNGWTEQDFFLKSYLLTKMAQRFPEIAQELDAHYAAEVVERIVTGNLDTSEAVKDAFESALEEYRDDEIAKGYVPPYRGEPAGIPLTDSEAAVAGKLADRLKLSWFEMDDDNFPYDAENERYMNATELLDDFAAAVEADGKNMEILSEGERKTWSSMLSRLREERSEGPLDPSLYRETLQDAMELLSDGYIEYDRNAPEAKDYLFKSDAVKIKERKNGTYDLEFSATVETPDAPLIRGYLDRTVRAAEIAKEILVPNSGAESRGDSFVMKGLPSEAFENANRKIYERLQKELEEDLPNRTNLRELKEDVSEWRRLLVSNALCKRGKTYKEHLKKVIEMGEREIEKREPKREMSYSLVAYSKETGFSELGTFKSGIEARAAGMKHMSDNSLITADNGFAVYEKSGKQFGGVFGNFPKEQYLAEIRTAKESAAAEQKATNFVLEKLAKAGIEVVTNKAEFDRIFEETELLQKMIRDISEFDSLKKQKEALEKKEQKAMKNAAASAEQQQKDYKKIHEKNFADFERTLLDLIDFADDPFLTSFAQTTNYSVVLEKRNPTTLYLQLSHNPRSGELAYYSISTSGKREFVDKNGFPIKPTDEDIEKLEKTKEGCTTQFYAKVFEDNLYERLVAQINEKKAQIQQHIDTIFINKNVGTLSAKESFALKQKLFKLPYAEIDGIKVYANRNTKEKEKRTFLNELKNSKLLASHNYEVFILPEQYTENNAHADTLARKNGTKNFEFLDLKNLTTKNIQTVRDRINHGKQQGSSILLYLQEEFSNKEFVEEINNEIKKLSGRTIYGTLVVMFEKSNQYIEYAIKKDGIQPISKDSVRPSTLAGPGKPATPLKNNIPQSTDSVNKKPKNFVQNGTTYGFAYEGKIYLDPELMNSESAVHEYTHLWDEYIRRTNGELWEKGKEIFKKTKYWDVVRNDPAYADIKDDEDLVASEFHARICGKLAQTVLTRIAEENGEIAKDSVEDWNSEAWSFLFYECWHKIDGEDYNLGWDLADDIPLSEGLSSNDEAYYERRAQIKEIISDFIAQPMKDLINERRIAMEQSLENNPEETFTMEDTEHLDRIEKVFGRRPDEKTVKYAESEAREFYWDSPQKDDGYSFKDFAAGQAALGYLYEDNPKLETEYDDFGPDLDELATRVAAGDLTKEELDKEIDSLIKNSEEIEASKSYNDKGLLASEKDDAGFLHQYQYDDNGRKTHETVTKESDPSWKSELSWDYDENGNVVHTKSDNGETWSRYDEHGNRTEFRRVHNGIEEVERKEYAYDEEGNMVSEKYVNPAFTDDMKKTMSEYMDKNFTKTKTGWEGKTGYSKEQIMQDMVDDITDKSLEGVWGKETQRNRMDAAFDAYNNDIEDEKFAETVAALQNLVQEKHGVELPGLTISEWLGDNDFAVFADRKAFFMNQSRKTKEQFFLAGVDESEYLPEPPKGPNDTARLSYNENLDTVTVLQYSPAENLGIGGMQILEIPGNVFDRNFNALMENGKVFENIEKLPEFNDPKSGVAMKFVDRLDASGFIDTAEKFEAAHSLDDAERIRDSITRMDEKTRIVRNWLEKNCEREKDIWSAAKGWLPGGYNYKTEQQNPQLSEEQIKSIESQKTTEEKETALWDAAHELEADVRAIRGGGEFELEYAPEYDESRNFAIDSIRDEIEERTGESVSQLDVVDIIDRRFGGLHVVDGDTAESILQHQNLEVKERLAKAGIDKEILMPPEPDERSETDYVAFYGEEKAGNQGLKIVSYNPDGGAENKGQFVEQFISKEKLENIIREADGDREQINTMVYERSTTYLYDRFDPDSRYEEVLATIKRKGFDLAVPSKDGRFLFEQEEILEKICDRMGIEEAAGVGVAPTIPAPRKSEELPGTRFQASPAAKNNIAQEEGTVNNKNLAPNGLPSNLSPEDYEYIHSAEFKEKFGDWEKAWRLEKLAKSNTLICDGKILLDGNDITNEINALRKSRNIKDLKKKAMEIGSTVKNKTYKNTDTGDTILLTNNRIREVSNHGLKNVGQIESIAMIPEIIENGIFIAEAENDNPKKPHIEKYKYLVTGLKINNQDYTVKSAIAVQKDGTLYYDHKLSEIEKGALALNLTSLVSGEYQASTPSKQYDKRLLQICQCLQKPFLDKNFEPTKDVVELVRAGKTIYDLSKEKPFTLFTAWKILNQEELLKKYPPVYENVFSHHATNQFGLQPFNTREGENKGLEIFGRLTTEKVDVLLVKAESENNHPHITLSTVKDIELVDVNDEIAAHIDDLELLQDVVQTTFTNFNESNLKETKPMDKKILQQKNRQPFTLEQYNEFFGTSFASEAEFRTQYEGSLPSVPEEESRKDSLHDAMVSMAEDRLLRDLEKADPDTANAGDAQIAAREFAQRIIDGRLAEGTSYQAAFERFKAKASAENNPEETFTMEDKPYLERIEKIFGEIPSEELIRRAETAAKDFFWDSPEKENGYSFKDFAAGQLAMGYIIKQHPELVTDNDDFGSDLDWLGAQIATGELSKSELEKKIEKLMKELEKIEKQYDNSDRNAELHGTVAVTAEEAEVAKRLAAEIEQDWLGVSDDGTMLLDENKAPLAPSTFLDELRDAVEADETTVERLSDEQKKIWTNLVEKFERKELEIENEYFETRFSSLDKLQKFIETTGHEGDAAIDAESMNLYMKEALAKDDAHAVGTIYSAAVENGFEVSKENKATVKEKFLAAKDAYEKARSDFTTAQDIMTSNGLNWMTPKAQEDNKRLIAAGEAEKAAKEKYLDLIGPYKKVKENELAETLDAIKESLSLDESLRERIGKALGAIIAMSPSGKPLLMPNSSPNLYDPETKTWSRLDGKTASPSEKDENDLARLMTDNALKDFPAEIEKLMAAALRENTAPQTEIEFTEQSWERLKDSLDDDTKPDGTVEYLGELKGSDSDRRTYSISLEHVDSEEKRIIVKTDNAEYSGTITSGHEGMESFFQFEYFCRDCINDAIGVKNIELSQFEKDGVKRLREYFGRKITDFDIESARAHLKEDFGEYKYEAYSFYNDSQRFLLALADNLAYERYIDRYPYRELDDLSYQLPDSMPKYRIDIAAGIIETLGLGDQDLLGKKTPYLDLSDTDRLVDQIGDHMDLHDILTDDMDKGMVEEQTVGNWSFENKDGGKHVLSYRGNPVFVIDRNASTAEPRPENKAFCGIPLEEIAEKMKRIYRLDKTWGLRFVSEEKSPGVASKEIKDRIEKGGLKIASGAVTADNRLEKFRMSLPLDDCGALKKTINALGNPQAAPTRLVFEKTKESESVLLKFDERDNGGTEISAHEAEDMFGIKIDENAFKEKTRSELLEKHHGTTPEDFLDGKAYEKITESYTSLTRSILAKKAAASDGKKMEEAERFEKTSFQIPEILSAAQKAKGSFGKAEQAFINKYLVDLGTKTPEQTNKALAKNFGIKIAPETRKQAKSRDDFNMEH